MGNFDAHKWFKKQYLEEGMSDEQIANIRKHKELEKEPQWKKDKETLSDLVALMKKHGMMDEEKSLREDDLDEIAFGAAGTDKRTGQVVGEIIELIRSTGVDAHEVMEELGQEFGIAFEFGRGF